MTRLTVLQQKVDTTCAYCGVGCGVTMKRDADSGQWVAAGSPAHPANRGKLCVKGMALGDTVALNDRLLQPSIDGRECEWPEAITEVASRLSQTIREHGPDSVAFYVSGQLLTEDYYAANKLMKGFIGSANIDTNSRLCMSTAVAAHKQVLGSDTVAGCYEDLELADLVIVTGSNMAWTHPVVYQRLAEAKKARPDMAVVVIDPRRTSTCDIADLHLDIQPGSDGFLFDGLFAWLISHDHLDHPFVGRHCEGFEEAARKAIQRYSGVAAVASQCGVSEDKLERLFNLFAQRERTVTVFSQGINQSSSGVTKAVAILQCHLVTGRIGKPGATPFSITGQPNAMGGREVGGLANQLAAHLDLDDPDHQALVSRFWQAPNLATRPGLKAVDLFDAVESGQVKAIWIMATNPVVSLPESDRVRAALMQCPTVIVSDCVSQTDTLACADIRLPAAAWGEKDGTVTNSERCISRQRAFLPLPGEAKPDWWIITEVARAMGFSSAFPYQTAADIFREHAALTAFENDGQRDLDLSALAKLSDAQYDAMVPVQWPVSPNHSSGTARLYVDGHFFTPSGKARLADTQPRLPARALSSQWPLWLITGRVRDQWHTMTRTARSARLQTHISEPFVAMHPEDMLAQGLHDGQIIRLHGPCGSVTVPMRADTGQRRGSVFAPIHWNDQFASSARIDAVVPAITDPASGQPEFKQVPVRIEDAGLPWHGLLFSRKILALPDSLGYWSRRGLHQGHEWRLAASALPDISLFQKAWSPHIDAWAVHEDLRAGQWRLIGYRDRSPCVWIGFARERLDVDAEWVAASLEAADRLPAIHLASGKPAGDIDTSPVICSCHQVRKQALVSLVQSGIHDVTAIGRACGAGTNCGSCVPELASLIEVTAATLAEEAL